MTKKLDQGWMMNDVHALKMHSLWDPPTRGKSVKRKKGQLEKNRHFAVIIQTLKN